VPAAVQKVRVPSELHFANVPVQAGKHVEDTLDVVEIRSAHVARLMVSMHVDVTRSGP